MREARFTYADGLSQVPHGERMVHLLLHEGNRCSNHIAVILTSSALQQPDALFRAQQPVGDLSQVHGSQHPALRLGLQGQQKALHRTDQRLVEGHHIHIGCSRGASRGRSFTAWRATSATNLPGSTPASDCGSTSTVVTTSSSVCSLTPCASIRFTSERTHLKL